MHPIAIMRCPSSVRAGSSLRYGDGHQGFLIEISVVRLQVFERLAAFGVLDEGQLALVREDRTFVIRLESKVVTYPLSVS